MSKQQKQQPNQLAKRIANMHGFLLKLGPKMGTPFIKALAYYSLYRIFTSGGAESLAFVCHDYMLREGDRQRIAEKLKQKGNHGRS